MEFQIVPMQAQHVPEAAAIERLCFSDPWSENSIRAELDNPLGLWLCALCGGRVAGYVGSELVPDEADMMNLAVLPEFRRQGAAELLLQTLVLALKERGIVSLTLEVRASNAPAIALYQKNGFRQVGCRKNYYFHPTEDAWILRKEWKL
jgi:ribosomal-protein-alanine N-acetyltransferase